MAITRAAPNIPIPDEFISAVWGIVAFLDLVIWFGMVDSAEDQPDLPPKGRLFDLRPVFESRPCACDESWYTMASSISSQSIIDRPSPLSKRNINVALLLILAAPPEKVD